MLALPKADVALPEPVAAEIAFGIARLGASKKRSELESRFRLVRDEIQIVPWTAEVTGHFGRIKAMLERRGTQRDVALMK